MRNLMTLTGKAGTHYSVVWSDNPPEGAMKEVFFAPDMAYAIALFKEEPSRKVMERIECLVGTYRTQVFESSGPEAKSYWERIFCWPYDIVSGTDPAGKRRIGLAMPVYDSRYFFREEHFPIKKGAEKKSRWYLLPYSKFFRVPAAEVGDWRNMLEVSLLLARGVRKLHSMGLAHSDLSDNNVLIDPVTHSAIIIDLDGLVVPGKFDAEVEGTPDYIAPEVLASRGSTKLYTPSMLTDRHALAVLIYQYLLCRHPLKGRRRFMDDDTDDKALGGGALFVENPLDRSARYDVKWVKADCRKPKELPYLFPWHDLDKLPYTCLGPYLSDVIERAFVTGLKEPQKRPLAAEWEQALEKTINLLHPCENPSCKAKWFVLTPGKPAVCPFCGTKITHPIPIAKFVKKNRDGSESYESSAVASLQGSRHIIPLQIVFWDRGNGQFSTLTPTFAQSILPPREARTAKQLAKLGVIRNVGGRWGLYNVSSPDMIVWRKEAPEQKRKIGRGQGIALVDGLRIQLDGPSSKVLEIQMV